jgi:pyruvate dehydrogenase (quinone)
LDKAIVITILYFLLRLISFIAIAAQIAFPTRQSIAFAGDGGFICNGRVCDSGSIQVAIKVIIIKNSVLGMIRWEQMAFLGNPEFGVEFTPIDYAKLAEVCGKRVILSEPRDAKPILNEALTEKPTIVEVYVDPFDPPMPPQVDLEFVKKIAELFAKGQPYTKIIGLTLYRN